MHPDNSDWTQQVVILCWFVSVYMKWNDKVLEKETEFGGGADKGGEGGRSRREEMNQF